MNQLIKTKEIQNGCKKRKQLRKKIHVLSQYFPLESPSSNNFDDIFQMRIQKPVKHLRWSVLDSLHLRSLAGF